MDKNAGFREIRVEVVLQGRRNNQCWFAPKMAVVPGTDAAAPPDVFVRVSQLVGNDMGVGHLVHTADLGASWTPPMESMTLLGVPREDHFFEKPGVAPFYHRATKRLLGLGATAFTRDEGTHPAFKMEKIAGRECPLPNRVVMAEWDFARGDFKPWQAISLPGEFARWHRVHWLQVQHEFPDGSVLVPFYLRERVDDPFTAVAVMRAEITGSGLACREIGNLLRVDADRGLAEPSVVFFRDRFFLTIRHDRRAYVAAGEDGLHYGEPVPWRFDDGAELGNFNTQQHWLARGGELFLLYNRKSELNNGVFRCRAPLYIARVDPDNLRVVRGSERIVFPEKGARMGNFSVANVTGREAWVFTGEWLEGIVPEMKEGDRFFVPRAPELNRNQYLGDLLLGRIIF